MKVLVILGHPRKDSYNAELADAYISGAMDAGVEIEYLALADLKFEMNVLTPSPQNQFMEADLIRSQELIKWADHLVFVFPTWWGNMPALLKGFIDRVFIPGFAFYEIQPDAFKKLLSPRTAQLIITMDTPVIIDRLVNGAPSIKSIRNATLKFCGVTPVRKIIFSPIKHSSLEKKQKWIQQVYELGKNLENGVLSPWEKIWKNVSPWLQAVRFQFYPMTFFAYGIGSLIYSHIFDQFNLQVFILGYVVLFLIEVITVFSNDYFDKTTDRLNKYFSTFSGGSRVLVNGLISDAQIKKAMIILFILGCIVTIVLGFLSLSAFHHVVLTIIALFLIAISYTAPPLKFSYNGLGELVVGFTHSFAVILCGFIFQGGNITNPTPWIVGIPLFFSIVPAIIMAGIPDYYADKQAGKGTLVVRMGMKNATFLAIIFVCHSFISAIIINNFSAFEIFFGDMIYLSIAHAILLIYMLLNFIGKREKPKRIDGIMALALMFILWFVLIPFFRLV